MTLQRLNGPAASTARRQTNSLPLQAVFEQASDGIALIDEAQTIVAMSPVLIRLVERPADENIGRARCQAVLACEDAAGCLPCDQPPRSLRCGHRLTTSTDPSHLNQRRFA